MLKVSNIAFEYDSNNRFTFPDISLNENEQSLLLGNSGSGKTTLLHLIAGFLQAKQGDIIISGNKVSQMSETQRDKFRGKNIGFIFQKPLFIQALNVKENIQLAQHLSGISSESNIEDVLANLGIKHKLNAKINELSEGEKQRVNIARALINQPKLILADEPTSALDDQNCEAVIKLLKDTAQQANATLLVVTHDNRLKSVFDKKIELIS